jgi:hypothetical protein
MAGKRCDCEFEGACSLIARSFMYGNTARQTEPDAVHAMQSIEWAREVLVTDILENVDNFTNQQHNMIARVSEAIGEAYADLCKGGGVPF